MEQRRNEEAVFGGITCSHRTLIDCLTWENEVGTIEEGVAMDSFWIQTPIFRERAFEIIDCFRTSIEPIIEEILTKNHPVTHAGAFPFFKCLYYSTSTIEELLNDNYLCIDFPMLGGFIGYEKDLTLETVEDQQESIRSTVETAFSKYSDRSDKLEGRFGEDWDVHWGFIQNAMQHPNIIYFAEEEEFLYASDNFENQVAPHSLFFDYYDIFLSSGRIDPNKTIKFEKARGYTQSFDSMGVRISDISIVIEEASLNKSSRVETNQLCEVPIQELDLSLRDMLTIEFTNKASR